MDSSLSRAPAAEISHKLSHVLVAIRQQDPLSDTIFTSLYLLEDPLLFIFPRSLRKVTTIQLEIGAASSVANTTELF
jgi:hypothetical protein